MVRQGMTKFLLRPVLSANDGSGGVKKGPKKD
jgi:hypothetical protein